MIYIDFLAHLSKLLAKLLSINFPLVFLDILRFKSIMVTYYIVNPYIQSASKLRKYIVS